MNPANKTTYSAKIGLMHVSDYGFSAGPRAWTTMVNYSENASKNRIHMGLYEWMLIPESDVSSNSFMMYQSGGVDVDNTYFGYGVRPVFNLISSINYSGGSGTSSDPITLSD